MGLGCLREACERQVPGPGGFGPLGTMSETLRPPPLGPSFASRGGRSKVVIYVLQKPTRCGSKLREWSWAGGGSGEAHSGEGQGAWGLRTRYSSSGHSRVRGAVLWPRSGG